jgi:hypothetical protein
LGEKLSDLLFGGTPREVANKKLVRIYLRVVVKHDTPILFTTRAVAGALRFLN